MNYSVMCFINAITRKREATNACMRKPNGTQASLLQKGSRATDHYALLGTPETSLLYLIKAAPNLSMPRAGNLCTND